MKKNLKYFYIGCAAFLFLAFIHWSYSYYQCIITFVGAGSIVYTEWRLYKDNFTCYMLIFLIIAILFNPFVTTIYENILKMKMGEEGKKYGYIYEIQSPVIKKIISFNLEKTESIWAPIYIFSGFMFLSYAFSMKKQMI